MSAPLEAERAGPAAGGTADSLIVLVHGYGADATDLMPLAGLLAHRLPRTAFAAPHAPEPCAVAPAGRQWFPLTFTDPSEIVRGVAAARPLLERFVADERTRLGLGAERLALLGFSQGTMMVLATGLLAAAPPAGIVGFSGLLALPPGAESEVKPRPVLLVHGADDAVVPADGTRAAAERLSALGSPVEWHVEAGLAHAISPSGLDRAATYLANLFGG